MRLACAENGHDAWGQESLARLREATGREPSDVLKTLHYRPEIFGRPFATALHEVMRGQSRWTPGERELFAAFVSAQNQCVF